MNNNKILVPVDFSAAAETAVNFAATVAGLSHFGITLLHVTDGDYDPGKEKQLADWAENLAKEKGLSCQLKMRKGNIFKEIPGESADENYELVVIGTHGFKGLREKFFGTDILKLVKTIPVPAIVIHKNFKVPPEGIRTIVFPAGTHRAFANNIQATIYMASLFGAEVHLYTTEKPGQDWSPELRANLELARQEFENNQIPVKRINEKQTTYSLGYARQILKYATESKADMIAVMSTPTPEHYYFADTDKELLLTNEAGIPVLCTTEISRA